MRIGSTSATDWPGDGVADGAAGSLAPQALSAASRATGTACLLEVMRSSAPLTHPDADRLPDVAARRADLDLVFARLHREARASPSS